MGWQDGARNRCRGRGRASIGSRVRLGYRPGRLAPFRGQARVDFGEVAEGIEDVREGLRVAIESAPAGRVCAAHVNLGDLLWFDEGPAGARALRGSDGDRPAAGCHVRCPSGADAEHVDEIRSGAMGRAAGDRRPSHRGQRDRTGQIAVMAQTYRQSVLIRRGVSDGGAILEARPFQGQRDRRRPGRGPGVRNRSRWTTLSRRDRRRDHPRRRARPPDERSPRLARVDAGRRGAGVP